METALEILLLSWILYCAWRVFSSSRPAIQVGTDVLARCPREFAYQTYLQVRDFYLQLSPAHKKYEIEGSDLTRDTVINVWEKAGLQMVKHQYRVTDLVPNERLALLSKTSQVMLFGLIKSKSRSEVVFSFSPGADNQTVLGLKIHIVFPGAIRHFLARLVATEAIWQSHAREEMIALARIIEQRYAQATS